MHSYMAHNGMLSTVAARLEMEKAELQRHLDSLAGGRQAALADALERQTELEEKAQQDTYTPAGTPGLSSPGMPLGVKPETPSGTMTPGTGVGLTGYDLPAGAARRLHAATNGNGNGAASGQDRQEQSPSPARSRAASNANAAQTELRHRRRKPKHPATESLPQPEADLPHGTSLEPSATTTPHEPRTPHPLAWSSDEKVALLARNIDAMEDELRSNGAKGVVWPQNITYRNFADFMIIPTLVYQLEYPRTNT